MKGTEMTIGINGADGPAQEEGDVTRDAKRWRYVLKAAIDIKTSRYETLCELLGVEVDADFNLEAAIDHALAAESGRVK